MFEDRTAEKILEELLDSITDKVDKRQGSIIYDALAPQSFLIAKFYQDLSWIIDNILFLDTATGEYLDKIGYTFGISRKQAIAAVRNVTFTGTAVNDLERFFTEDGLYWIYDSSKNHVICEQTGTIGNTTIDGSSLIPVNNIPGLTSAIIESVVIPGVEKENDDLYRQDIIQKIKEPELNSNRAQIEKWCKDIVGVGNVRIFSLWNGPNTVKAVILNTESQPASQDIINQVQSYIDPGSQGLGEGVADIGVIFTTESATPTDINISFKVTTLAANKTLDDVKTEVTEALKKYLKSIAFLQEKNKDIVRYQEIASLILNSPSVIDFEELLVNDTEGNIEIELENVAAVGTVTVS